MQAEITDLVRSWAQARRLYLQAGGDVGPWTDEKDEAFDRFTDAELALANWAEKERKQ